MGEPSSLLMSGRGVGECVNAIFARPSQSIAEEVKSRRLVVVGRGLRGDSLLYGGVVCCVWRCELYGAET